MSALAQLLGTQERVVLFATSSVKTTEALAAHLPLDVLAGDSVECVCGSPVSRAGERATQARLVVVDWDCGGALTGALGDVSHAVAFDPPYRTAHLDMVCGFVAGGASAHLLYTAKEREDTKALLRHLVHPRFSMICMYRAMQGGELQEADLLTEASRIAFEETGLVLPYPRLAGALNILRELGLERLTAGKAKLDAQQSAAYQQGEAEYRECVRLCLTL
jgi:hypothetical protein